MRQYWLWIWLYKIEIYFWGKHGLFWLFIILYAIIDAAIEIGVFPLREAFHEVGRIETYKEAEGFYKKHFLHKDED